ncbi:MAG TPA: hypothetical protein VGL24_03380 [Chthoniobacterales bacterium]
MFQAPEIQALTPFLSFWHAYDPAVKSDLYATAVKSAAGLFLVDPIPLEPSALEELTGQDTVAGILLTNSNHLRAAERFSSRSQAPVFCAQVVAGELVAGCAREISDKEEISPGVSAIAIEGAAPGETAFHFAEDGGTIVVGDALINFEPYGFTFLPPKYCADQKEMRHSLRRLLDWPFQRLLFAHGTPILNSARERLETLLR